MDKFADYIDSLSARHGRSKLFNDFLTIAVCCLSMGKQEELYLKTIKSYSSDELKTIICAFSELVIEMDNNGLGLKDVLGEYYEKYFHNEKLGQFFTPPALCKLMADINPIDGQNVYDPCCGSGRIFLAAAENDRTVTFYGADISEICCKMTLINMCLNGLKCRVSWMNSLSMEVYKEWGVIFSSNPRVPYIIELEEEKQIEELAATEEKQNTEPLPLAEQEGVKPFKFKRLIA